MALQFNSNEVNRVFWNGTKTTKVVPNKTFSYSATSGTREQISKDPVTGGIITLGYRWEATLDTGLPYTDINTLTATATSFNVSIFIIKGDNGNFAIQCSGYTIKANSKVTGTITLTGTYTIISGELNRILFNDKLVWKKAGYTLDRLEGSVWKMKDPWATFS
jgi:hypothetical protein